MEEKEVYYRLRPLNDNTIDELSNHYLWCSFRSGFKDVDDANIAAFIDNTPQILEGLKQRYTEEGIQRFVQMMDMTGICCFTKSLPLKNQLRHFPNGQHSLCIAYDKNILDKFFLESKYRIAYPFHDVIYTGIPTKMDVDGDYHIMTQKKPCGDIIYESIYSIFSDPKKIDYLFYMMFARLNKKFQRQNESRIIIGGRNIEYADKEKNGYRIEIPSEAILMVFLYSQQDDDFMNILSGIDDISGKIQILY